MQPAQPGGAIGRTPRRNRPRVAMFAALVGIGCGAASAGDAWLAGHAVGPRLVSIAAMLGGSAAVAAALAWPLAATLAGRRPAPARFSAMTVLLALGTVLIAGMVFVASRLPLLDLGAIPFPSRAYFFALVHSSAASLVLFAGTAPRLLLPAGPAVLFAAAIAFARRLR